MLETSKDWNPASVTHGIRACAQSAERHRAAGLLLAARKYHEQATFLLTTRLEELAKALAMVEALEGGRFAPINHAFWHRLENDASLWALFAPEMPGVVLEDIPLLHDMALSQESFKRFVLHVHKRETGGWIVPHEKASAKDTGLALGLGDALARILYARTSKSPLFADAQMEIPRPTWLPPPQEAGA